MTMGVLWPHIVYPRADCDYASVGTKQADGPQADGQYECREGSCRGLIEATSTKQ